jgi:hypothetical protein
MKKSISVAMLLCLLVVCAFGQQNNAAVQTDDRATDLLILGLIDVCGRDKAKYVEILTEFDDITFQNVSTGAGYIFDRIKTDSVYEFTTDEMYKRTLGLSVLMDACFYVMIKRMR